MWLFFSVLIVSCEDTSSTEKAGMEAVQYIYGGKVVHTRSIGTEKNYFEVEISETMGPVELDPTLETAGHYIGLLLYDNLSQQERKKYDGIKIILKINDKTISRTIEMPFIKNIYATTLQCRQDLQLLLNRQYDEYGQRLKKEVLNGVLQSGLFNGFDSLLTASGPLLQPVPIGIDTFANIDSINGNIFFIFRSAIDTSARFIYGAQYRIDEVDSIFGIKIIPVEDKKP